MGKKRQQAGWKPYNKVETVEAKREGLKCPTRQREILHPPL